MPKKLFEKGHPRYGGRVKGTKNHAAITQQQLMNLLVNGMNDAGLYEFIHKLMTSKSTQDRATAGSMIKNFIPKDFNINNTGGGATFTLNINPVAAPSSFENPTEQTSSSVTVNLPVENTNTETPNENKSEKEEING